VTDFKNRKSLYIPQCCLQEAEVGDSMFPENIGIYLQVHAVLQPRTTTTSFGVEKVRIITKLWFLNRSLNTRMSLNMHQKTKTLFVFYYGSVLSQKVPKHYVQNYFVHGSFI
jgi:hypothetical protein